MSEVPLYGMNTRRERARSSVARCSSRTRTGVPRRQARGSKKRELQEGRHVRRTCISDSWLSDRERERERERETDRQKEREDDREREREREIERERDDETRRETARASERDETIDIIAAAMHPPTHGGYM